MTSIAAQQVHRQTASKKVWALRISFTPTHHSSNMVYTLICHAEVKPGCEQLMADKLREAAAIYKQDSETIDWIVAQDSKNPLKFSIVERFVRPESQEVEHLNNPYWKTFNPAVEPWLAKPIEINYVWEL